MTSLRFARVPCVLPLLAVALLCDFSRAQVKPHARTAPMNFTGAMAPGINWFPVGRTKGLIQYWFHGSHMDRRPILELGVRPDTGANAPAIMHKMEIVMSDTTRTFSTMSTTFTQNLGASPVTFVKLRTISWPAVSGNTDPNFSPIWIKGDRPFVFLGPHMLVQFDIQTEASPNYVNSYHADANYSSTAYHLNNGTSCGRGSLASSSTSNQWALSLSALTPNTAAIFVVGFSARYFAGAVPLPLDLTPFGMENCTLNVDPLLLVPLVSTSAGTSSLTIPFTLTPNEPLNVYAQAIVFDSTKSSGLATTNARNVNLSGTGNANYVYNWTTFTSVAQYGPYPINSSVVLLFRP